MIGLALQPIPHDSINSTVSEFTNVHVDWNWSRFEHWLPNFILMKIASVMPLVSHLGYDKIYWCFDPKGMFTVRSAYDSFCHQNLADHDKTWNLPWT